MATPLFNAPPSPSSTMGFSPQPDGSPPVSNAGSGRPKRTIAGRRSLPAGFVPTEDAVKPVQIDPSSDDDEDRGYGPRSKKRKRTSTGKGLFNSKKLRGNRKSPPPPPLSPSLDSDLPPPRDDDENAVSDTDHDETPRPIELTFNIPAGHQGPFTVKLDLAGLSGSKDPKGALKKLASRPRKPRVESPKGSRGYSSKDDPITKTKSGNSTVGTAGFLDLPAELRVMIYDLVFISPFTFNLAKPENFQRSAAFLATCRQVHDEARPVLYSKNRFEFERQTRQRNHVWDSMWSEIAYKDTRRFLKMIGPDNISMLRDVHFAFEDGLPTSNPGARNADALRYVNDDHVIDCLKMLGNFSQLQRFSFSFYSRKNLNRKDERFLKYLVKIQADSVDIVGSNGSRSQGHYWGYQLPKYDHEVGDLVKQLIKREEKLYEVQDSYKEPPKKRKQGVQHGPHGAGCHCRHH
ncbi:MAG: hypothetical protein M1828_003268 [Chrysothrix sp. TS-e1954]|nr:MAG: hypothetical protein M1828_003268 [Chrysothrix sp. TS-e1954]